MSVDSIQPAEPEKSKSTSTLSVTKDQAASLKIGLAVRFEVVGEVKEITRSYNDKEEYNIVLEDPLVKNVTPEDGEEEKEEPKEDLATMPKEDLKKIITKKD